MELGTITGAVSFSNNLSASTFTTTSYLSSLSLLGSTTVITNPVTIFSNGTVTLGDGGDTLTFNGGFVNTPSPTTLNGTFKTSNDDVTFAALTVAGNSSISTGSGNVLLASISVGASTLSIPATSGTITVTGAVTGAGTLAVQIGTSTGNVTFSGNVSLGTLTFGAGTYRTTMTGSSNTITSAVTFANTGGVTLGDGGDAFTFDGGLTSTASATTTVAGNLTTSADNVSFNGLSLGNNSSFSTTGGTLTVSGAVAICTLLVVRLKLPEIPAADVPFRVVVPVPAVCVRSPSSRTVPVNVTLAAEAMVSETGADVPPMVPSVTLPAAAVIVAEKAPLRLLAVRVPPVVLKDELLPSDKPLNDTLSADVVRLPATVV
ncbi:MAG: hypothetical protein ACKPHU_14740, partial [Planctomycetaceae bacterium]